MRLRGRSRLPALIWATCAASHFLTFAVVNYVQPKPYMDEIFHVPQAQRFCMMDLSWDPMITTLPGLYIISIALLEPLAWMIGPERACTALNLRLVNLLFAGATLTVTWLVVRQVHGRSRHSRAISLVAPVLSLFPVHFFFSAMYYTDIGSTFFVLLMYYLTLRRHHAASGLAGALAILMRQTNVIWVAFAAGSASLAYLHPRVEGRGTRNLSEAAAEVSKALFGDIHGLVLYLWPYVAVLAGFVAFVLWNDGIVVGDRTNHTAGLHLAQVGYFVAFAAAFSSPVLMASSAEALLLLNKRESFGSEKQAKWRRVGLYFLAGMALTAVYIACIGWFTVQHKYLLADNRHYTFYVWKRILSPSLLVRYLWAPVNAMATLAMWASLSRSSVPWASGLSATPSDADDGLFDSSANEGPRGNLPAKSESSVGFLHLLWRLGYCFCVLAVLAPQQLIEFRYFIVSYLIYRIHLPIPDVKILAAECLLYTVVNMATVYLFAAKPFAWDNEPAQWQRFIW